MAMPPDTGMPCSAKVISSEGGRASTVKVQRSVAGLRRELGSSGRSNLNLGTLNLFIFPKTACHKLRDRLHRVGFVVAARFYGNRRTFCSGEHHHTHDAFGVDALATSAQPDFALESTCNLSELG